MAPSRARARVCVCVFACMRASVCRCPDGNGFQLDRPGIKVNPAGYSFCCRVYINIVYTSVDYYWSFFSE